MSSNDDSLPGGCWVAIAGVIAVAITGVLILFSGAEVPAGHVGVVGSFGAIDQGQQPLSPGFHTIFPVLTHIDAVSTQPQNHKFREVAASSRELQNVYVDGGVNYVIDSRSAAKIVVEGGEDAVIAKVFDPAFQDYMKEVVPQYGTTDILSHRAEIRDQVKRRLSDKAGPYGLDVVDVFITNIHFDDGYSRAIEQAQEASQHLVQAQNEAKATVAKAQGQADANRILAGSLSDPVLRQKELENDRAMIDKWNGNMPQVVGSGNPLIQLTK
jgi:regulator of protease activity HflC (stomatin/prohibitin superfamily)